jgi:acyl-CoA hydrolase
MESLWIAAVVVGALALAGMAGMGVRFRARSAKQWRTSLDAYAEREIARRRRQQTIQRAQAFFTFVETSTHDGSTAAAHHVLSEEEV